MSTIRTILDQKGHEVFAVGPDDSVFDAIKQMARRNIGALMVVDDGRPVGMFTERHYARNVFLQSKPSPETPVHDVMSLRTAFARPENKIDECLATMTREKVRHLPVLEEDRLVGIVSIGDLVQAKLADQEFTIEQLENYIHG